MKKRLFSSFSVWSLFFLLILFSCKKEEAPSVETGSVMNKTDSTITVVGNVTDEGSSPVLSRGICWSRQPGATVKEGAFVESGKGVGYFQCKALHLDTYTVYYIRAFATNANGTGYGQEIQVETNQAAAVATVYTSSASKIGLTTAFLGGQASNYGGGKPVVCGVCWSQSPNPDLTSPGVIRQSYTGDIFEFEVTGLEFDKLYYYKAYIVNAKGTTYGAQKSFRTANLAGLQFVQIGGGTFNMGSLTGNENERPVHAVTLSPFKMATSEVSQALWEAVMGPGTATTKGDSLPFYGVTYYDVLSFLGNLNRVTGKTFRLPTEAEWEYAAGGGSSGRYVYAAGVNDENELAERAWYGQDVDATFSKVATRRPNSLGLYDMSGNVWEYCSDDYKLYSAGSQTDPKVTVDGRYKIIRGGSYLSDADSCRTSCRAVLRMDSVGRRVGFRLVQSL